jgi:hypothetical protein
MRVRIIFRGLVLFEFEKPRGTGGQERGALTARLVNDPNPMGPESNMHKHSPTVGIIGRTAPDGARHVVNGVPLPPAETRFEMQSPEGIANGVTATTGFDNYVPRLKQMRELELTRKPSLDQFPRIVIPHGTIRSRDLVSWDSEDGNPPAAVAFMDTFHRGFVANEAVVDIGDDTDFDEDDPARYLSIASRNYDLPEQLWPLAKGDNYIQETDPNTVEILVTNFAPQRRRGVFWSLHYQWFFEVAGYATKDYTKTPQYQSFERVARAYDQLEWEADKDMVKLGHPFPFIITDDIEFPQPFTSSVPQVKTQPPNPAGRGKRSKPMSPHHGVGAGNDPWARPICPLGQMD